MGAPYCECLRGRRAPKKPNLSKFILFYGGNNETMEVSYGIGVTNRYALFYDENEDPMDVLKSTQVKEASVAPVKKTVEKDSKPDKTKPAEVKAKTAAAPAQVKKGPKETQPIAKSAEQIKPREDTYRAGSGVRPPRGERGGRYPNAPREQRNNQRNEDRPAREFGSVANTEGGAPAADGEYRPRSSYRGAPRGDRGGARGARGAPRGRGDNRGKRDFDRQSGSDKSGVKPVEKREGSGPHNWGSVQDEIEGQMEPAAVAEEVVEGEAAAPAEVAETKEGEEAAPVAPEEQEPQELTLDEWRALRGERKKPEFNIRKPGEGEDNSQWKKTFVLDKKKDEDEDEEEIVDYTAEYPQRVGRQKFLDIEIRFSDSRRGTRGAPGGRGRGRGEGGGYRGGDRAERGAYRGNARGGNRGARGATFASRGAPAQRAAPKVDDEKDFP